MTFKEWWKELSTLGKIRVGLMAAQIVVMGLTVYVMICTHFGVRAF